MTNNQQEHTIQMKNLTSDVIILIRQDGTRAELPACPNPPIIEIEEVGVTVGYLGELEIVRQPHKRVIFPDWVDDPKGGPYIVSKIVFDALPADATDFVTPDYNTAILNGLKIPHVIRRFIMKASSQVIIHKKPIETQLAA